MVLTNPAMVNDKNDEGAATPCPEIGLEKHWNPFQTVLYPKHGFLDTVTRLYNDCHGAKLSTLDRFKPYLVPFDTIHAASCKKLKGSHTADTELDRRISKPVYVDLDGM
jgi:hypothetical protein